MGDNADAAQPESRPDDFQVADIQSTITSECCIALPIETICHVLHFLGPHDLIRLQTVSRLFRTIIDDPTLWRTIYSTTRLPLPPGPYPWQSIRFLQRALVHSVRVARTWTTEPLALLSTGTHKGPRSIEDDRPRWVCGRWLIVSKGMKLLRVHDVETGAERVLWDHGSFSNWAAASLMIPQAHYMYVVVHLGKGLLDDPVKLLEFTVDDDTGHLSGPEMIDVPTRILPRESYSPSVRVSSGNAPYVYVSLCAVNKPRHSLVFDPRNRQFCKFPRFRTRVELLLNYPGAWLPHLIEVYFTPTHLFVLSRSYLIRGNVGEVEVIQTFTFPDINTKSGSKSVMEGSSPIVHELRLTHEMLWRDTGSLWLVPMHSATDPITQTTTLRFMHTYVPLHPTHGPDMRVRLVCIDYVLAESPPPLAGPNNEHPNLNTIVRNAVEVLPITITSYDILSVHGLWRGNLVDVSHDGLVRGICGIGWPEEGYDTPTGMAHKFTVDATGDRCVAVLGDPSPPWRDLDPSRHYEYTMDAMRGKIWYTRGGARENDSDGQTIDRDVLAIVVDFK